MDKVTEYGSVAEALIRYVETNTTDQTDGVLAVPTRQYTDPQRWAREMDTIFKRLPLLLALSAELPKAGDYKAMDVIGLPVLITRDKDGKAHALSARIAVLRSSSKARVTAAGSLASITAGLTPTTDAC